MTVDTNRDAPRRPTRVPEEHAPPPVNPDELGTHASGAGVLGDLPLEDEELRADAVGTPTRDDEPGGDLRPDEIRSIAAPPGTPRGTQPSIDEALDALDRAPDRLDDLRTDDRRAVPGEHESAHPLSGEPRAIEGSRGEALREGYEQANEDEDPPAASPGRLGH